MLYKLTNKTCNTHDHKHWIITVSVTLVSEQFQLLQLENISTGSLPSKFLKICYTDILKKVHWSPLLCENQVLMYYDSDPKSHLFFARVQTKKCIFPILLATFLVFLVNLFIGHLVKQVRQELITLGWLQVKYAAGPTAAGNWVHVNGLALVGIILEVQK